MEVLESWMVERLKIGKFHFDACGLMEVVWGWYRPSAFVMTHITTSLHLSSLARIEPTQTYAPWWICWVLSNCFNMFQTFGYKYIYIYTCFGVFMFWPPEQFSKPLLIDLHMALYKHTIWLSSFTTGTPILWTNQYDGMTGESEHCWIYIADCYPALSHDTPRKSLWCCQLFSTNY
jgi:hypothetical protein